jgi:hypothetical protein
MFQKITKRDSVESNLKDISEQVREICELVKGISDIETLINYLAYDFVLVDNELKEELLSVKPQIKSVKQAQTKILGIQRRIGYIINNFPEFPDTFVEEEEEEDPCEGMDFPKGYGWDDNGDLL